MGFLIGSSFFTAKLAPSLRLNFLPLMTAHMQSRTVQRLQSSCFQLFCASIIAFKIKLRDADVSILTSYKGVICHF